MLLLVFTAIAGFYIASEQSVANMLLTQQCNPAIDGEQIKRAMRDFR